MFNAVYYANMYPDLKAAFGYDSNKLYNHYVTCGIKEGRSASPVFDPIYYIDNNSDLKKAFGNNNVKYNTWYYGRTVSGSGHAWCMAFQAYCCNQITGSNNAVPKTASCTSAVNEFKKRGQFYYSKYYGGNYTPKAGDIVYYTNGSRYSSCHVGMIISAPVNGYLQTVEGNIQCSDGNWKVVKFTKNAKRTVNSSYVLGYAAPNY